MSKGAHTPSAGPLVSVGGADVTGVGLRVVGRALVRRVVGSAVDGRILDTADERIEVTAVVGKMLDTPVERTEDTAVVGKILDTTDDA